MDPSKLLRTLVKGGGSILVPHIDAYLERDDFPDTWEIIIPNYKTDDGFYHPSSHAFTDPRWLYYDRVGARSGKPILPKRQVGAQLQRTFACGHLWHGYIGSMLMDMGFVDPKNVEISYKKEIENEYGVSVIGSGTLDLLDVIVPGHGEWLVDMKTVNSLQFNNGIADYTMMKWEAQVNLYGDWAGRDKMMILAIEKDSPHRLMEFQIRRNDKLLDDIYTRWIYTELCIQQDDPPECEHGSGLCELGDYCSEHVHVEADV